MNPAMTKLPPADELISAISVSAGFDHLARSIQPVVDKGDSVLLGIMIGALYPLMRLADRLTGDFRIDYCHATRYQGGMQGQTLRWLEQPHVQLEGQSVIVIDDIFDAGITLQAVADYCRQAGARQVLTAVMAVKDRARSPEVPRPDFDTGLTVPDRYVFGCGMDLGGHWRHLPAIYALRPDQSVED